MRTRYYEHGVYAADITFSEGDVRVSLFDRFTGSWQEETLLTADNAPSEFPFGSVLSTFEAFTEAFTAHWAAKQEPERIDLPDGRVYRRFEEYGGAKGKKAAVWALCNKAPLLDLVVAEGKVVGALWTNRNGCSVIIQEGWEDVTPVRIWDVPDLPPAALIRRRGMELVPMRDGVRLATEVWLPQSENAEDETYPVVLMRTPYNRRVYIKAMQYLAERGYALVSQDVRGRHDSEGEFIPFSHEMTDGEDTLDWLVKQPWCDGNIGMIGPSYLGKVQWQAAATGHPNLKALVSQVAAGGPFVDAPRPEGAFASGFFAWIFMMSERATKKEKMQRDDWQELLKVRPLRDIPEKALGYKLPFWEEWMKHPHYDAFWAQENWALHGDKIDVPALLISGWYDDDGMGTAQAWEMNAQRGRKNQKMLLGPWMHNYNTTRCIHGVEFGLNSVRYDLDVLVLRWFERFLKGVPNGIENEPPVEYYEVGSNRWRTVPAWPPREAVPVSLYLHSNGRANGGGGNGALTYAPPMEEPEDVFVYDPKNPVPHLIAMEENEMAVPENYRDVEKREDILVYTSEILTEPVMIAGHAQVVLYASTDAVDTDWLVRLTDVDEEGNSIRLVDRLICTRYRESFEKPKPLTPQEVVRYEIRLPHVANAFQKGHRIRLQVCSSASQLYFPNPNTGNLFFEDTEFRIAEQRVYHGKDTASRLILPVIKG